MRDRVNRPETTIKAAKAAYEVARELGWSAQYWDELLDDYQDEWCRIVNAGLEATNDVE